MRVPRVLESELKEQIVSIGNSIIAKNCSAEVASVKGLRKEIARLLTKKYCGGCGSAGVHV